MDRSYPLVEIHYALWTVLSVPLGFAGLFFLVPGLTLEWGLGLLAVSGLLVFYISKLARGSRATWLFGIVAHALVLLTAVYYVPRWPTLLGVPLAVANAYSLTILVVYRSLWTEPADEALREALA